MGKFILGFVVSTALFMGFALIYAINDEAFIRGTCNQDEDRSDLYVVDDADRALVCKYLRREVGLDQ